MSDINLNLLGIKRINCNSQSGKEKKTKVTVCDVLKVITKYTGNDFHANFKKEFPLENGAVLRTCKSTHYIEAKSENIFVIKKLGSRDVKVDKNFVEDLKENSGKRVSYVEINKKGVNIISDDNNSDIDELIKMFNKCVNIGTDGLESDDSGDSDGISPFDLLVTEDEKKVDGFDLYEPLEPNSEGYLDVNGKRCKL